MASKVIFLDVDGTLVDYENHLPESAVEAIRKARANGHLVYICTGRSHAEVPPKLWDIGLDGMIGGNGSYVEHQGEVVMHQMLSEEDSRAIVDWLHERGLEFYLESGNLYRNDLNKISFILKSYQDHLDSKEAFPHLKVGTWGGRGETALFGDLGVANIDKAHAIDVLLDFLDKDKADTIAFGDAKVDIPMLDYCAIGVAMGNGGPEILAMADMITDDVEDDGLYKAFEKLGLLA